MTVEVGKKAPAINLPADNGEKVSLNDFKGKNIVLYFYPKDDTPGCTAQACSLRDDFSNIKKLDAVILGVSPDGAASHEKFIAKFDLPFTLLSDEDHSVAEKYGVWVEKNMYGRKYMGVARRTFIIGKDGNVAHIFCKVNPKEHAAEVMDVLKTL